MSVGRDDTGDWPIVELDRRLAASIARDRELLSQRERDLFEKHILGQLGDALRSVRIKADELVTAMNNQLHDVTTSQGIRVEVALAARDDILRGAAGCRAARTAARRAASRRASRAAGGAARAHRGVQRRHQRSRMRDISRERSTTGGGTPSPCNTTDRRLRSGETFSASLRCHRASRRSCAICRCSRRPPRLRDSRRGGAVCPGFVLLDDAFPKIDTALTRCCSACSSTSISTSSSRVSGCGVPMRPCRSWPSTKRCAVPWSAGSPSTSIAGTVIA